MEGVGGGEGAGAVEGTEAARLRNLFNQLDSNSDGRIDAAELTQGLHDMGYAHITADQIAIFLKKSDSSHSGDLTLSEFMEHLGRHEKQLHFVFSSMDSDKSGRVTSAEVKVAFNKLGVPIGLEEAEKLVARLDDDNSLDISFEEWRDYLLFHPSSNMDEIISYWRRESYLNTMDHGEDVGTPGRLRWRAPPFSLAHSLLLLAHCTPSCRLISLSFLDLPNFIWKTISVHTGLDCEAFQRVAVSSSWRVPSPCRDAGVASYFDDIFCVARTFSYLGTSIVVCRN
jgi:solute carrier family 25 phosphate transporter 23/24/25/41